jgi:hypothetical protein
MAKNSVPGLPSADEEILADVFGARWPTGAEKAELEDGCPVFYGRWDERDVEIAERTYPGRIVLLDQEAGEPGTLRILPSGDPPIDAFALPVATEVSTDVTDDVTTGVADDVSDYVTDGVTDTGAGVADGTKREPRIVKIEVAGE